jgi:hypothetical protein
MQKVKIIGVLLSVFVTLPIWFYLLHSILSYINASDLEWFLYWIYVPVGIFGTIIAKIAEGD